MTDYRKLPRKKVDEPLEVFDPVTQDRLGRLVNITVEGFMLYGGKLMEISSIHQLDMPLPRPVDGHAKVSFGAEVVWSSTLEGSNGHWSGFHIIAISDQERDVIGKLIANWGLCPH